MKLIKPFLIALIIIAFQIYCTSTGVDLTDQGYLLGNSSAFSEAYFFPVWGSAAISNIIQMLFGDWTYFVLKLIPQLSIFVLLGFFLYILKRDYKEEIRPSLLIPFLLLIPWSSRSSSNEWLYYSTLSGFFIPLSILNFEISLKRSSIFHLITALTLILLSIAAKITNIVFIGLIPLYFYSLWKKKENIIYRKTLVVFLISSGVFFLFFSTALINQDIRQYLEEGIFLFREFLSLTKVHSPHGLLKKNMADTIAYLKSGAIFSLFLMTLYFLIYKIKNFSLVSTSIACFLFISLSLKLNLFEGNGLFFIYLISLSIILFSKSSNDLQFLVLSTIYFLVFNSLGSSSGLRSGFIAEPLCAFIITYFVLKHRKKYSDVTYPVVLTLFFSGCINRATFTYRDLPRLSLTSSFETVPRLRGLYTNSEKRKAIEEIYILRQKIFRSAKNAIIYPSAPLLHYVLNIDPFLPNPWINLYFPSQLERFLTEYSKKDKPDVIIKILRNPRMKDWPTNTTSLDKDQNIESIKIIDQFIFKNKYKLINSTGLYEIYQ